MKLVVGWQLIYRPLRTRFREITEGRRPSVGFFPETAFPRWKLRARALYGHKHFAHRENNNNNNNTNTNDDNNKFNNFLVTLGYSFDPSW